MREKIMTALTESKNQRAKQQPWSSGQKVVHGKDYAFMLSVEQRLTLKEIEQKQSHLLTCLQTALPNAAVMIGTSTSVEIQAEAFIVIELSLYGNLASLFVYGEILEETSQHINQCLQDNQLVPLVLAEREELEQQGIYYDLF